MVARATADMENRKCDFAGVVQTYIKDSDHYEICISMAEMKKDINYLKSSQDETKADIKEILHRFDCLDDKFANKWVEKISIASMVAVIGAIITFVITK